MPMVGEGGGDDARDGRDDGDASDLDQIEMRSLFLNVLDRKSVV